MRIAKSFVWSSLASIGTVFLAFFVNLILVRLVSSEAFGMLGMLNVFIAFSHTTVSGGFSQALIQRRDVTQEDLNTCFTWNVASALILYVLLYLLAPHIARMYGVEELSKVLRVLALAIPIQGFYLVQNALVQKHYQMRKLALISIGSAAIGGGISIVMAWRGYGVWSLVANTLLLTLFTSVAMWVFSSVRMRFGVSRASMHKLFGFGVQMYASTLLDTLYKTFQNSLVGKFFGVQQSGCYYQGQKIYDVPVSTMDTAISQVTYPLFSEMQRDSQKIQRYLRYQVQFILWVVVPLLALFSVMSEPLVILLYTEQWLDSVSILRLLLPGGGFLLLMRCHLNVLKALGYARLHTLVLLLVLPLSVGISLLIAKICIESFPSYALRLIVLSFSFGMLLGYFVSAFALRRKFNFLLGGQVLEVLISFGLSYAVAAAVYFYNSYFFSLEGVWSRLVCHSLLFVTLYLPLLMLVRKEVYRNMQHVTLSLLNNVSGCFKKG